MHDVEADRVIAAGLEAGRTLLLANKEDRLDAAERDRLFETLKDGKFFQGGAPLSREMVCFVRKFANTLRRWAEFSLQRTKTCKWAGPE